MNLILLILVWEAFCPLLVAEEIEKRNGFQPTIVYNFTPAKTLHLHAKWCIFARFAAFRCKKYWHLSPRHAKSLRKLLIQSGDIESNPGPISCPTCASEFIDIKNLRAHEKRVHLHQKLLKCSKCDFETSYTYSLKRHAATHVPKEPRPKKPKVTLREPTVENDVKSVLDRVVEKAARKAQSLPGKTALKKSLRIVSIPCGKPDPNVCLSELHPRITNEVQTELDENTGVKVQVVLTVKFYQPNKPQKTKSAYFRSNQMSVYRGTDFDVTDAYPKILKAINEFQKEGSGWAIENVVKLEIYLAKLQPLRGSTFTKLPAFLRNKKAIVNVQNNDDKCFMWSVLSLLYRTRRNPQRVSSYKKYQKCLNMTGIEFPVKLKDISKFEKQNHLSVNVYGFDAENEIYPLRISETPGRRWLHLLLYKGHYVAIRSLNKLLYDQTKHKAAKFFCYRCLFPKTTPQLLANHLELCQQKEPTRIVMPDADELKFSNIARMLRQPLVIYGDFECLTTKCEISAGQTERQQKHIPCGYGLLTVENCCGESEASEPTVYCGENAVRKFIEEVLSISSIHQELLKHKQPIPDVYGDESSTCHICKKNTLDDRVRDHCHICGKFRGIAHKQCNREYRISRDVTVVFHNLRKYDGHLIMQEIGKFAQDYDFEIEVVAKAMEDYVSFSLVQPGQTQEGERGYRIRFIDSVQFLNNSLAGLVKNLDPSQLVNTKANFSNDGFKLVTRKGVYPYDYMDSWEKFDLPLPEQPAFYSKLLDETISDEDYQHACAVYEYFGLSSMREYHNLYLKTDILLLADVFEEFRSFALDKYGLDPCHYMTTPSLAWDACLKMTEVKLELIKDPDMYIFCELGIRGGICQISHRWAEANNPYVEGYDAKRPTTYIMYLDANNLYGWAMVQKLPVRNFKWISEEEKNIDWEQVDTDGDTGYILEVDLSYPKDLHDKHDQYPLAPEAMELTTLSPYSEQLRDSMGMKIPPQTKLVPNLFDKKKYIVHFRNLKLYLQQGMKLDKIHRGLKFYQEAWMERYIMFNTRMRAAAISAFAKDLFKLLNNAVFGKTMENVRKYKVIELVFSRSRFLKLVANPRYKNCCRFNEDLVGVCMLRSSTCMQKPIYCGLAVLDMSKELMYRFHYEYMLPKYGTKVQLLFTDTDSLCYAVETKDIYSDMLADAHLFDFSDYPKDHSLYSIENKKVIGKMKDETAGEPIQKFCGLRPKMYAMWPEKKRAKGIKKSVVEKKITFDDYKATLFDESSMTHSMTVIRSHKHQLYTETMTKKSLSAYDDKRWLLDAVKSRARGHYLNNE